MLVLSRKPSEVIRFPQLGISVAIVSVKGSRVQVGINAPPEIQVLRNELETGSSSAVDMPSSSEVPKGILAGSDLAQTQHDVRNRLNKAILGLHLAQRQLAAGRVESADKTLGVALSRLAELEASASNCFRVSNQPIRTLRISEQSLPSNVATSEMQTYQESAQRSIDVLLVEDDTNEQALLRGILEMEGYRVHTANNGHEALDCLKRVTPRFVLLDMMMPECDGRETFQRIRRMPALENLPIFAVSGASPDSLGLPVGKDGVEDWFPKPLNAPQLVEKMRQCVQDLSECV